MTSTFRHVERRRPLSRPHLRVVEGRFIVIDEEVWGRGFDVFVDPPMPDGAKYARELPTIEAARAYAAELRFSLELDVRDRTEAS